MTREHISSFVGDLVAMAKAMEELPQVQEQLADARSTIEDQAATIQRLELQLMERANELQAKLSDIRTLEVARDDAELRFLEADERTASALAFVRTVFGNAGALIQALDPPKVEAEIKVSEQRAVWEPIPPFTTQQHPVEVQVASDLPLNEPVVSVQEGPIVSQDTQWQSASAIVEPMASVHSGDGENLIISSAGPYSGKRYIDHPGWLSREDWLAGGGTDESYDWREGHDAA